MRKKYAPSAAVAQMAESVLLDKKRIFPACVYLEGEFGVHGLSLGVPIKLGANGVEQIMDIELTKDESSMLSRSIASVKELVDVMYKKNPN